MATFPRALCVFLVLAAFAVELCASADDYYARLGVPRDASHADIKRAFRQLTIKHHPDKGGDAATFEKISHAYDVLSDSDKRRNYDQFGDEKGPNGDGGGRNPFGGGSPFDFFTGGFGGFHFEQRGNEVPHTPTVQMEVDATLEDLYTGKTIKVAQRRQVLCKKCRGSGAENPNDVKRCTACGGSGVRTKTIRQGPFIQQTQSTCDVCGGKGKIITSTCKHCHGTKIEQEEEVLTVWIEQGMTEGAEVVFPSQADEKPDTVPGDVKFVIRQLPHDRFVRSGNDLHTRLTISLLDALVGFNTTVKHLDGHLVAVSRTEVTKPGLVISVRGEGMPQHSTPSIHGDLHVEFVVRFPMSLSEEQKAAFRKLLA